MSAIFESFRNIESIRHNKEKYYYLKINGNWNYAILAMDTFFGDVIKYENDNGEIIRITLPFKKRIKNEI